MGNILISPDGHLVSFNPDKVFLDVNYGYTILTTYSDLNSFKNDNDKNKSEYLLRDIPKLSNLFLNVNIFNDKIYPFFAFVEERI